MRIEGRIILKAGEGRVEVTVASNTKAPGLVETIWPAVSAAVLDEAGLGSEWPSLTVEVDA